MAGDETTPSAAEGTKPAPDPAAEGLIREVKSPGRRVEEIRAEAGEFVERTGEALGRAVEAGRTKAAGALHDLAEAVRTLAGKEPSEGSRVGELARKAADGLDRLSDVLKDRSFEELGQDVRRFVRERPGLAIGTAAVLGFALARLLKSGGEDGDEA
ncbi:MAG: hypothetical protein NZM40_05050 [Sphingomonadaceae bacterium]|uniref:hypothetical protein n=1 Tax=Thermaurantiacus sp. TaxID=2820283 RepID=UPI00298F162E|nr:hypothetical protein [Thermaurantiacus sp.]MCS6986785.1 hypothetical protein [Sphingomonadaceae bacterium]MDW8413952.1 hypothetical protein [Thermaurantiacus sp.]